MTSDVRSLDEIGRDDLALVGGKAANLGELRRIDGVRVPPGLVVTAPAYDRAAERTGSAAATASASRADGERTA